MEEEKTDEMEVAKKTSEKGKEEEKAEESKSRLVLVIIIQVVLQIIPNKEVLIIFNSNNIYKLTLPEKLTLAKRHIGTAIYCRNYKNHDI